MKKILTVTVIQMMTCTVLYDCDVILYMTIIVFTIGRNDVTNAQKPLQTGVAELHGKL